MSALLASKPEVIECDRVTGDDCFIAKAVVASVADLEKLIDDILPLATTNTAVIQSSPVRRRTPPLPLRGRHASLNPDPAPPEEKTNDTVAPRRPLGP